MEKWEHAWDTLSNYNSIIAQSELLNKRSEEGWEMVSVVVINVLGDERLRFYWKRKIIN